MNINESFRSQGLKSQAQGVELQKQVGSKPAGPEAEKLKGTCQDFESIFVNFVLSKMRDTVPKSDLMGSDHGEDIYRGMLDEQISKQVAASGGIGLGDVLYRQLSPEKPVLSAGDKKAPGSHPLLPSGIPSRIPGAPAPTGVTASVPQPTYGVPPRGRLRPEKG